jgi:hypothetical protein
MSRPLRIYVYADRLHAARQVWRCCLLRVLLRYGSVAPPERLADEPQPRAAPEERTDSLGALRGSQGPETRETPGR